LVCLHHRRLERPTEVFWYSYPDKKCHSSPCGFSWGNRPLAILADWPHTRNLQEGGPEILVTLKIWMCPPRSLHRATTSLVSERWRRSFSRSWAFSLWARILDESRSKTGSFTEIGGPSNRDSHRSTRIAARTEWFNGIRV